MLSQSSHEVHSALRGATLLHSLHPTPLTSHDHLLSRKLQPVSWVHVRGSQSKQSYRCCMQTDRPEEAEHMGHCCATSTQPFRECWCLSERLVELESFSPSWPLKVHAAIFKIQLLKEPMFLSVVTFSNVLLCQPKAVMWYVDVMLLLCVCGSLLTLAWAQFPEETFPTHYWKTKVTTLNKSCEWLGSFLMFIY